MHSCPRHRFILLIALAGLLLAPYLCPAHADADGAHDVAATDAAARAVEEMARAAYGFLAALDPQQVAQATFAFDDAERFNWHFVPRARKGLSLKGMTPTQRHLAQALLASGLSQKGYVSAVTIMSLEQVLQEIEKGKGPVRDPELYYFTIFGKPAKTGTWGWRFEGHHLSINFTIVNGTAISAAPHFFGSNPGIVRDGPRKGTWVLQAEEELGRALLKSLSSEQRKSAIIAVEAPADIITGNSRKANIGEPAGVSAADLNADQRHLLAQLVTHYARRLRPEIADQLLQRIVEAGTDKVRFAWAGGTESGQKHYYRIHGPTFLIEYDNTQNDANHIHTTWRDLQDDFGEDLLKKHYEEHTHGEKADH